VISERQSKRPPDLTAGCELSFPAR
jgi:hypothetical protein